MSASAVTPDDLGRELEEHRLELRGFCYRMLASPFDAEDAVQDTFLRAWRSFAQFGGRSSLRSWLYRIATNVCLDMLRAGGRRARPMDLGPAREPVEANLTQQPEASWVEPIPDPLLGAPADDPAEAAVERESVRLAFIAALQHLPPRQRAALILCQVLQWRASEVAELLDTSVASVNSALQRARASLEASRRAGSVPALDAGPAPALGAADRALLARYVQAFEDYDMDALASLIREDAVQSMPPYDLWLSGRDAVLAFFVGPGSGCRGSRLVPVPAANGLPAFGQYKPSPHGGYEPWALQAVDVRHNGVLELTFFLATQRLFPLFGLPPRVEA